ncbi:MAG TPA: type I glyceraldehyde-3-phosphate dehydrogenase [Candidatus Babeliales bacterium]|nr:type I glyceraldehyde-3-phosphate dehydrogenase [Candidatus Babeliales bacterium]
MIRVAINGFGRIGRNFLRSCLQDADAMQRMVVVAINIGSAQKDAVAHMFKYDTLMGIYPGTVAVQGDLLEVDGYRIALVAERDPEQIAWGKMNIDWVAECSGHFTKREGAIKHIQAGAKKVLISAPAHGEDIAIIPGVNDAQYNAASHAIVSLGSCTTNAWLPMLKVIHDAFTIERSFMTTVHAYTNTQVLLDVESDDLRRSRAAACNIIPTSTGASQMISKVLPELAGLTEAVSLRVPVAKVSLIDLVFITKKSMTVDAINDVFQRASEGPMKGIMGVTQEPLVSSDFSGDARSVIIDSLLTITCGDTMGKAFGWYDNEWGYSCRMKDFLVKNG